MTFRCFAGRSVFLCMHALPLRRPPSNREGAVLFHLPSPFWPGGQLQQGTLKTRGAGVPESVDDSPEGILLHHQQREKHVQIAVSDTYTEA